MCSRSFINDTPVAFDPERAMAELVLHTHYLPRHWRGRAHSAEVQQALNSMFSFKLLLFLEELASVLLTPFILAYSLPRCAGEACRVCTEDHSSRSQFTT
jgi:autophagy-related protein 9